MILHLPTLEPQAWDGILWSLTMPLSLVITIETATDIVARFLRSHSSWELVEIPWEALAVR